MFRMYGNKIEIYRYSVIDNEQKTLKFVTLEEAKNYGEPKPINIKNIEWLDGIEVKEDGDVYAKAMDIYNMGELKYKELISKQTIEQELEQAKQISTDLAQAVLDLQYQNAINTINQK